MILYNNVINKSINPYSNGGYLQFQIIFDRICHNYYLIRDAQMDS